MQSKLLCDIDTPSDLRKLSAEQLPELCEEVREFIIEELSKNPGHFASSLGAVELTVALHYVYNTPEDRIVWDVGHQAYAHKILTGRRNQFRTNRSLGGICGFPSRDESIYDAFVGGHASVSISAALGMAVASQKEGSNRQVIAVIGDGSMTGGLAFEGLNNASSTPNDLLIILNDNNMAIDTNVGGLSRYLLGLSTSKCYNRLRNKAYAVLVEHEWLNPSRKGAYTRLMNSFKSFLTNRNSLFEGLNIRYFGPIDGHNVHELTSILEEMKHIRGPKLLHVITKKGKGYAPAEKSATEWHAPGRFNPKTGERVTPQGDQPPLFQDVFGETIIELAKKDQRIVGITPAMPTGCSLNMMAEVLPDRVFDVGIAEAHAVTFSAGLATEGMIPFCNIYSSFLQRSYDQIIHDVALQKLPVIFCLDRAGLVGEDGATHHGAFDISYLRCVPNLILSAPMDEQTLRHLMLTATTQREHPFAIRYPRGRGFSIDWRVPMQLLPIGKGRTIKDVQSKLAVLSIGTIGQEAAQAIEKMEAENINVSHFDMIFIKPLDTELIDHICQNHQTLVTIEDGSLAGGFGSAVLEYVSTKGYPVRVERIGIPDRFILHGSVPELRHDCGIDASSIAQRLRELQR